MWNNTDTPLALFISFRTYGTWLHGDRRGSINRFHNRYKSPYMRPNTNWELYETRNLKKPPVVLTAPQRQSVEAAIRETCDIRHWSIKAINVRTNHVHVVVIANKDPSMVLNAFKANATRQMRKDGVWQCPSSPWGARGSKRRLWNERSVEAAINYVLNGQGEDLPDFDVD